MEHTKQSYSYAIKMGDEAPHAFPSLHSIANPTGRLNCSDVFRDDLFRSKWPLSSAMRPDYLVQAVLMDAFRMLVSEVLSPVTCEMTTPFLNRTKKGTRPT